MKTRHLSKARRALDMEREANRARLGLAGPLDKLMSSLTSGVGDGVAVTFESAFPKVEYTVTQKDLEDGGSTTETKTTQGTDVADWLLKHVVRPKATIKALGTQIAWAPGEGQTDWSWAAWWAAWGLGIGSAFGLGWLVYRAFFKRHKNPPRRARTSKASRIVRVYR